jgi:hypothetical protein
LVDAPLTLVDAPLTLVDARLTIRIHLAWMANGRRRWTWTYLPLMIWLVVTARPLRSALTSTATLRLTRRGDDLGELGDVVRDLGAVFVEAIRVRCQGRRHAPYPAADAEWRGA